MTSILVIEDESSIRENILDLLQYEGYHLFGAANGEQGLEFARQHHPDLILCDIMMPGMDGFEVLRRLREDAQTRLIPVVFLTALADRQTIREGMGLGADDYITKPFTHQEILDAITSRLKRQGDIAAGLEQHLTQAKEKLMQMVAHELRTPLISINMVQDIISRRLGQLSRYELEELLETLGLGSRRLSHLVEQVVYMTQLEAQALSPQSIHDKGSSMRLWELLTVSMDLGRKFATRNPDVFVDMQDRDNEAKVLCDANALKYALGEIIANALKFSPKQGTVTLTQWQAEGQVWISIVDQGKGMSSEQLTQIFDPFHQLDRATQEQQGIGMGLPLAKRIIQAHGGDVHINSVVDKGTQVVIRLPIYEEN